METKAFDRIELKADGQGYFEALISTFDKRDKYGDIMRRGAFARTIGLWRESTKPVPVYYAHLYHDPENNIGEVEPEDLEETRQGLCARGRLYLNEPRAAKVFRQLVRRTLNEWSFAFDVDDSNQLKTGRELLAVTLHELGPCLVGVGDTATLAVKATAMAPVRPDLDAKRRRIDFLQRRNAIEFAMARGH